MERVRELVTEFFALEVKTRYSRRIPDIVEYEIKRL
jgi:hypothetical protein